MELVTIYWEENAVHLIDQTKLPLKEEIITIVDYNILASAIKKLQVRGAPAIGVAGAFGLALAAVYSKADNSKQLLEELAEAQEILAATRPTAVNLFWALNRVWKKAKSKKTKDIIRLKAVVVSEAKSIWQEDKETCYKIGKNAAPLFYNGDVVLTHCNAGALATVMHGTALAGIYQAVKEGKKIRIYADETRPLLQGARLTAWELQRAGIPVTVICDNMAATLMKQGKINKIITGADRIAANGDAANKIGTYGLAVLAKFHKIPFYIAAPISSFDPSLKNGEQIPIEERARAEITMGFGKQTVPENVPVYNPAFDVTPAELITAWISEKGIAKTKEELRSWY